MEEKTIKKKDISLLDLDGECLYCNTYCFKLKDGFFVEYSKESTLKLLDPVLDQTFKWIFTYGEKMSSIPRLKSFLNSLLYSKYNELITDIEYSPNELTSLGSKGRKNLSAFDIVVKAKFESKNFIFINIEIQTTFHNQLFRRWIKYATELYSNLKYETLVLVLQINEPDQSSFYSLAPYITTYSNPIEQEKIEGTFEIISIDLNKTINLIKENKKIKFGDITINKEGEEWLKLIGLRFWTTNVGDFYLLPIIKNACNEIKSAMKILSSFTEPQIKEIFLIQKVKETSFEDGYIKGFNKGKIEERLRLWMNLFKNRIDKKLYPNLYSNFEEVTEDEVKKLFNGDSLLEPFIQFLKQNNKIKNK